MKDIKHLPATAHRLRRRGFLKGCALSGVSIACAGRRPAVAKNKDRPNILILESDQHMPDAMSCAGHKVLRTPHMDRLAREGVHFTQAICPSPLCQPSRVAMLTGRYPSQNGVLDNSGNHGQNFGKQWTFPRALQESGYYTGFIGKTHLGQKSGGLNYTDPEFIDHFKSYGFDSTVATLGKVGAGLGKKDCPYTLYLKEKGVYEAFSADMLKRFGPDKKNRVAPWYAEPSPLKEEDFHDCWISAQSARWIKDYQEDAPFFLWVNWGGPHSPYDAPGKYSTMYDPKDVDLPYQDPREGYPAGRHGDTQVEWAESDVRPMRANYYGLVNVIDDGIGQILQALEERGILDNTLVIFCADHGEMMGNHGVYSKQYMFRDAVGVPLIVSHPWAFEKNLKIDAAVGTMDLIPTILEVSGAPIAEGVQGKSLVPILTGQTTKHAEAVFSEMCSAETVKMVRTDRYKYILGDKWMEGDRPYKALLFDLREDPRELNNLSGSKEHSEVEQRLRKMIEDWSKTLSFNSLRL